MTLLAVRPLRRAPPRRRGRSSRAFRDVHDKADARRGRVRNLVRQAFARIRDRSTLAAIGEAAERGRADEVVELLGLERGSVALITREFAEVRDELRALFAATAVTAVATLPKTAQVAISFDLLNPQTVRFIQRYEFDLIRGIDSRTRAGIRAAVTSAFEDGLPPAKLARRIRSMVGLTDHQVAAVGRFRSALADGSTASLRGALRRALRDRRFDAQILAALESGDALSPAQVERMAGRFTERMHRARALNIARTETIRAANAGQQALWMQAREQGLLDATARRFWIVTPDDRLCPICEPIPGLNPDGVELQVPFISPVGPVDFPPVHPQCRCAMSIEP